MAVEMLREGFGIAKYRRVSCDECGTYIQFAEDDMNIDRDDNYEIVYTVPCPKKRCYNNVEVMRSWETWDEFKLWRKDDPIDPEYT